MKILQQDKVQHIFRHADPHQVEIFTDTFNEYSQQFNFKTDFQVNAFLAQIEEEVGYSLTPKRENLNYSCDALRALFGYYKKHPKEAKHDGRCRGHKASQRDIANKAYGGRLKNRNHNDGWLFRGAGYIQLTGRGNYKVIAKEISKVLGHDFTAEDLASEMSTVEGALLSAMAFYFTHRMYKAKTVGEMTAIVNKKTPTYAERKRNYRYIASL